MSELIVLTDNAKATSRPLTPKQEVLDDLSSLFGYQLAGAGLRNQRMYGSCSKIVDQGLERLSKIGVFPAQVQGQPKIE
jgi:hypothetical protein